MVKISKTYVPKESEKYMCEKHKVYFKKKLSDWKIEIVRANNEALYNFGLYQKNPNHTILVALYDGIIVGTAAVLIEYKIRGNICAHIEDVVVDNTHRGHGTGKLLIEELVKIAKHYRCYKVILDCSEENISFYKKCGFKRYENCMRMDLNEGSLD